MSSPVRSCLLATILIAGFTTLARAADAVRADLPAVHVGITRISDSRSSAPGNPGMTSNTSNLSFAFSVTGDGLPLGTAIRGISITRAADEEGRVLPASTGRSPIFSQPMRPNSTPNQGLTGNVNLPGAMRKTRELKFIEGTIDMFLPDPANGSAVRIPNIRSHRGKIENPYLKAHGIEIHFLPDQASADTAKALMTGVNFDSTAVVADSVTAYGIVHRDPSVKLIGIQVLDGRGNSVQHRGNNSWGNGNATLSTYNLTSPLPEDAQLLVFVAVPESIKTVPFRIEDIQLP